MKKFINDNFVAVWIEDKREDMFAKKVNISQQGYPNIAVYDASAELIGRVIGFGGKDPWFAEVKSAWEVGDKLQEAKAKAEANPAGWADVAAVLAGIPDREKDALETMDKIPEKSRGKDFKTKRGALAAKVAWIETDAQIDEHMQAEMSKVTDPSKRGEALKEAAPKAIEMVDAWLKAHAGADGNLEAGALAKKGFFLVRTDRKKEAAEVALKILKTWPESDAAQALLNGLR